MVNENVKRFNTFNLLKIIFINLLVVDIIVLSVFIYMLNNKTISSFVIPVVCASTVLVLTILINAFSKKAKAFTETEKKKEARRKLEEKRLLERKERESSPPCIDFDKLNLHPDLKNLIITNRNIDKYIPNLDSEHHYIGIEPSLIDEYLPADIDIDPQKTIVRKLPADFSNLSYEKMSPAQRGMYLKFLQNPYEEISDTGYVMVLLFGLERHLMFGESGHAAEIIEALRAIHNDKNFLTFSFNALAYYGKKNDVFLDFLRREYYYLNLNFTLYYHLKTDKIFPIEAMIRFKHHFHFPNDAANINPVLFKNEIEALLEKESQQNEIDGYSMEKYARGNIPRLENLPFPANRSMDKIVNKYIHTKNFYEMEPFNSDVSDLLKRGYMNTIKNNVYS